jgi:hypothetical protein
MEVHIKSYTNNSRMNKIMCNKNVSSSNKKDYWHSAWATELKMVTYSTSCSIRNDQNTCECKKELCHVWPSGKIISFHRSYACRIVAFMACLDVTSSGLNLPSNHVKRPTELTKFRHCSYGAQFAIGSTIILRPQKDEPQTVGITALKI